MHARSGLSRRSLLGDTGTDTGGGGGGEDPSLTGIFGSVSDASLDISRKIQFFFY